MHVQAVFLDLDGTLLDYDDEAWADTVLAVCAGLGRDEPGLDVSRLAARYSEICRAFYTALEDAGRTGPVPQTAGLMIWRDLWGQALADCGHGGGAIADRAVAAYLAGRARRYRLSSDALPAIEALRTGSAGWRSSPTELPTLSSTRSISSASDGISTRS
jgi:FMN phosphatase YigB (HAD superfamily)